MGKKRFNDCSDSIVELAHEDVDFRGPSPKWEFVEEVAQRVVRQGCLNRPGFAYIPDTRSVLNTRAYADAFHKNLVSRLDVFMQQQCPAALKRQPYVRLSARLTKKEALKYYGRTRRTTARVIEIDGLSSFGHLHMDVLQFLFCSLIYGQARGIQGGSPLFFDALRCMEEEGLRAEDILKTCVEPCGAEDPFDNPYELWMEMQPRAKKYTGKYMKKVGCHKPHKFPIVVFSNHMGDGILHGATRVYRKKLYAARPLRHRSIVWAADKRYGTA